MPKRTIAQTVRDCGAALPDAPRGSPSASAASRRERTAREVVARYGDPLLVLARLMVDGTDPKLRADCARALAPYLYPSMRALEVSGAGGEPLIVEIRKAGSPGPSPVAAEPGASAA